MHCFAGVLALQLRLMHPCRLCCVSQGFECTVGSPLLTPCPTGKYCPGLNVVIDCPTTTYNPYTEMVDGSACLPCPAGYFCNETSISYYGAYECPVGHYCPIKVRFFRECICPMLFASSEGLSLEILQASEPLPCGSGRYRSVPGATSPTDCPICPGGHMCTAGSVTPVPCPGGTWCDAGVSNFTKCASGTYCPPTSSSPTLCPPSHFCETGVDVPALCPLGTYCPPGSSFPLVCRFVRGHDFACA